MCVSGSFSFTPLTHEARRIPDVTKCSPTCTDSHPLVADI